MDTVHAPNDLDTGHFPGMGPLPVFRDRDDAGEVLARSLRHLATEPGVLVFGLARGGVPIARYIADEIGASFSVLISRKIGVPGMEEVALGAIAEGNDRVVPDPVARNIGIPPHVMERMASRERVELARTLAVYRDNAPLPDVRGRTVILVDDGLESGATLRAAARAIRAKQPKRLIAAVPVASRVGLDELRDDVDEIVAPVVSPALHAVSSSYECLAPLSDNDVLTALGRPSRRVSRVVYDISGRISDAERTIEIRVGDGVLFGALATSQHFGFHDNGDSSDERDALVILARNGDDRSIDHDRYIAGRLRLSGYATLRIDLSTRVERDAHTDAGHSHLDVGRVAARLTDVCDWAVRGGVYGARRMILVGAGNSAAAALVAAGQRQGNTLAVVVRGAQPDASAPSLARVRAPVLMIVGDGDREALELNRLAMRSLPRRTKLIRIPGAGRAFAEPGALGAVAEHTAQWLDGLTAKWSRSFPSLGRSAN